LQSVPTSTETALKRKSGIAAALSLSVSAD
jgi:hypothetical protein